MTELQKAEKELFEMTQKVAKLRRDRVPVPVKNYSFKVLEGEVSLLSLFGDKQVLFMIHNMGQGCRYCTLWADGLNAFLPHLESRFAVVLVSKDQPELQRTFAHSRGWRFRMASHGGGSYIQEQTVVPEHPNSPGLVCYERKGSEIYQKNIAVFGPGDEFCSLWNVLSLAGLGEENFTPQYRYWSPPKTMEDGGKDLL